VDYKNGFLKKSCKEVQNIKVRNEVIRELVVKRMENNVLKGHGDVLRM
jgi:hypothetical protein